MSTTSLVVSLFSDLTDPICRKYITLLHHKEIHLADVKTKLACRDPSHDHSEELEELRLRCELIAAEMSLMECIRRRERKKQQVQSSVISPEN